MGKEVEVRKDRVEIHWEHEDSEPRTWLKLGKKMPEIRVFEELDEDEAGIS